MSKNKMNYSEKTMAFLGDLPLGTLALTVARKVKGEKVQIEFAEKVNENINIAALINASDERFNQSGPRRAWISGAPEDIKKQFGVDVSGIKDDELQEIHEVSPKIFNKELHLRIVENTKSEILELVKQAKAAGRKTDSLQYLLDNEETEAKRRGTDGPFITSGGENIYSRVFVVGGIATHRLLEADPAIATATKEKDQVAELQSELVQDAE